MSSGGVMLSGWLRKSPPERKLRRNAWKKRWFVLRSGRLSGDPNVLEYFRHQGSRRPIKAISLDECSQIDANVPIKYDRKDPHHQFVFDIVTRARTYYLVAESNLEMSSWVRYLCDLCGFNHDTPQNQDLGTQQQTFKAVSPIDGRNYQNGTTTPLIENEERPVPLPRPVRTITNRSILIRDQHMDANENFAGDEVKLIAQSRNPSVESGVTSATGPVRNPALPVGEKAACNFAKDPITQPSNGSDYLLLADCKTAESAEDQTEDSNLLSAAKLVERRTSTDSVFTHDGATSDAASDVVEEQPLTTAHMRFVSNIRKQRLDSMPDCPPPPPPIKGNGVVQPLLNTTDERGYSYHVDDVIDEDIVVEARKRSYRSPRGLSPIDDSEINVVPLSLQREFRVDKMGKPLTAIHHVSNSSNSSSHMYGYNWNSSVANYPATEYINTTHATAEAGFGSFSTSQKYDSWLQRSEQQSATSGGLYPYASSANRSASSQFTNSPVFFNSPTQGRAFYGTTRNQAYDMSSPKPVGYSSPRHLNYYNGPHAKGSLYSSTSTLSPHVIRGSSSKTHSPLVTPVMGMPKLRRSSSVGQLEIVANELAAETLPYKVPNHGRRRSIDHRTGQNNMSTLPYLKNTEQFASPSPPINLRKSNTPPPRPPKSEETVKRSLNERPSPVLHSEDTNDVFESSQKSSKNSTLDRPKSASVSPPHATIVSPEIFTNSSPSNDVEGHYNNIAYGIDKETYSPVHSNIVATIPISDAGDQVTKTDNRTNHSAKSENSSRSVSSSSGSGSSSESQRSRSSGGVYDITSATAQHTFNEGQAPTDTSKSTLAAENTGGALLDSTSSNMSVESPVTNGTSVDETSSKQSFTVLDSRRLPEVQDDIHPNYEMMLNQEDMLAGEGIDDTQLYTCMAGSNALINSPVFTMNMAKAPSPGCGRPVVAQNEPPPVKRDLKPGRKSLGSDSGISDTSKQHHSRNSFEDSAFTVSVDSMSPSNQSHASESSHPLSPPHATIVHTLSGNPVVGNKNFVTPTSSHDRLMPPERPPKHPSQSSLSPRTPPSTTLNSHLPGRPCPVPHGMDRAHKVNYDTQITRSPSLPHSGIRQRPGTTPPVPGRPPKPPGMTVRGTSPSTLPWDDGTYPARSMRELVAMPTRPPKSNIFEKQMPDYGGNQFFPNKFTVVPPPQIEHAERELKYVELRDFPTANSDSVTRTQSVNSGFSHERPSKHDEGVQYILLDREKTEALEKMKKDREREQSLQKRGSIDSKTGRGGR